jgi:hypothetical protein
VISAERRTREDFKGTLRELAAEDDPRACVATGSPFVAGRSRRNAAAPATTTPGLREKASSGHPAGPSLT